MAEKKKNNANPQQQAAASMPAGRGIPIATASNADPTQTTAAGLQAELARRAKARQALEQIETTAQQNVGRTEAAIGQGRGAIRGQAAKALAGALSQAGSGFTGGGALAAGLETAKQRAMAQGQFEMGAAGQLNDARSNAAMLGYERLLAEQEMGPDSEPIQAAISDMLAQVPWEQARRWMRGDDPGANLNRWIYLVRDMLAQLPEGPIRDEAKGSLIHQWALNTRKYRSGEPLLVEWFERELDRTGKPLDPPHRYR